jgi:hypothetical protein
MAAFNLVSVELNGKSCDEIAVTGNGRAPVGEATSGGRAAIHLLYNSEPMTCTF